MASSQFSRLAFHGECRIGWTSRNRFLVRMPDQKSGDKKQFTTNGMIIRLSVVELPYPVQPQRSPKALDNEMFQRDQSNVVEQHHRVTFTPPPCFFAPFHIQHSILTSSIGHSGEASPSTSSAVAMSASQRPVTRATNVFWSNIICGNPQIVQGNEIDTWGRAGDRSMAKRGNDVRTPSQWLACDEKGDVGRCSISGIMRKGSMEIISFRSSLSLCCLFLASSMSTSLAQGVRGKDSGVPAREGPAMAACTSLLGFHTSAFGGGGLPCRLERNVERAFRKRTTIVCLTSLVGIGSLSEAALLDGVGSCRRKKAQKQHSDSSPVAHARGRIYGDNSSNRCRAGELSDIPGKISCQAAAKGSDIKAASRGRFLPSHGLLHGSKCDTGRPSDRGGITKVTRAIENNVRAKVNIRRNVLVLVLSWLHRPLQISSRQDKFCAAVPFATYNEYLPGVIGFSNELERYAVLMSALPYSGDCCADQACFGQGCSLCDGRYVSPVAKNDCHWNRNGPIRHKYDSMKYVVRKVADEFPMDMHS
eukprot:170344-Hanusia_phi.AAC.6